MFYLPIEFADQDSGGKGKNRVAEVNTHENTSQLHLAMSSDMKLSTAVVAPVCEEARRCVRDAPELPRWHCHCHWQGGKFTPPSPLLLNSMATSKTV